MNSQPAHGNRCRARLNFGSLVMLTSLVGFCAGVLGAPLVVILQAEKVFAGTFWVIPLATILIGSPILGALNGALYGTLGYPLYRWITRKVDVHTYTGDFTVTDANAQREI